MTRASRESEQSYHEHRRRREERHSKRIRHSRATTYPSTYFGGSSQESLSSLTYGSYSKSSRGIGSRLPPGRPESDIQHRRRSQHKSRHYRDQREVYAAHGLTSQEVQCLSIEMRRLREELQKLRTERNRTCLRYCRTGRGRHRGDVISHGHRCRDIRRLLDVCGSRYNALASSTGSASTSTLSSAPPQRSKHGARQSGKSQQPPERESGFRGHSRQHAGGQPDFGPPKFEPRPDEERSGKPDKGKQRAKVVETRSLGSAPASIVNESTGKRKPRHFARPPPGRQTQRDNHDAYNQDAEQSQSSRRERSQYPKARVSPDICERAKPQHSLSSQGSHISMYETRNDSNGSQPHSIHRSLSPQRQGHRSVQIESGRSDQGAGKQHRTETRVSQHSQSSEGADAAKRQKENSGHSSRRASPAPDAGPPGTRRSKGSSRSRSVDKAAVPPSVHLNTTDYHEALQDVKSDKPEYISFMKGDWIEVQERPEIGPWYGTVEGTNRAGLFKREHVSREPVHVHVEQL